MRVLHPRNQKRRCLALHIEWDTSSRGMSLDPNEVVWVGDNWLFTVIRGLLADGPGFWWGQQRSTWRWAGSLNFSLLSVSSIIPSLTNVDETECWRGVWCATSIEVIVLSWSLECRARVQTRFWRHGFLGSRDLWWMQTKGSCADIFTHGTWVLWVPLSRRLCFPVMQEPVQGEYTSSSTEIEWQP